jgi:hypothetical protein
MWVVKICKLCIYAGFNFIDQSEAVCCQRAGVCHLLCTWAVLTCILLLTLCTWFPTHPPDSVSPLPALALPAVAPAACRVFVFRLLNCARWLLAGLPPAACRPRGLPACPPLWLFARSRAIDPSPSGCLPGVRLLADVCISASAYLISWFVRLLVRSFVPSPLVLMSVREALIVCCVCPWHSVNGGGSPFCQPCWQCPVLFSLFALCRTRSSGLLPG